MDNQETNGSAGPIVASVIIILVIIIGGVYFWKTLPTPEGQEKDVTEVKMEEKPAPQPTEDLNKIEMEFNKSIETDFQDSDKELQEIDSEFNAQATEKK